MVFIFFIVNFKHFLHFASVSIIDFEQVNVGRIMRFA